METTRPAITATGLSRTYGYCGGGSRAVCDVDLTVAARSLTALVGPPGAGTSTLLQCLAGTDRGSTGRVVRHGVLLPSGSPGGRTRLRRARVGVVGVIEEPAPMCDGGDAVQRAWDAAVADVLGRVEGWGEAPSTLAAARRALAAALVHRPDVMVADEPTADLDAASATAMIDALVAVVDRLGVTVVVATHDPRLAERADRVLTLEAGSLVADSAAGAEGDSPSRPNGARAVAPARRIEPAHP